MVQVLNVIGRSLIVLCAAALALVVLPLAVPELNVGRAAAQQKSSSMVDICAQYDRANLTGCLVAGVKRGVQSLVSRVNAMEDGPACGPGRNLAGKIEAMRVRMERLDADLQTMLAEAASKRLGARGDEDRLNRELEPLNREIRRYRRSRRGSIVNRLENLERRVQRRCPPTQTGSQTDNEAPGDPFERAAVLIEACEFEVARDAIRDLPRGSRRNRLFDRYIATREGEQDAQIRIQRARDIRRNGGPPGQVKQRLRDARKITSCEKTLKEIEELLDE